MRRVMLGKAVRARRIALGLTQAELATRAQIDAHYIARIESSHAAASNPTLATLLRLAGALECEVQDLLGDTGEGGRNTRRRALTIRSGLEGLRKMNPERRRLVLLLIRELSRSE